LSALKGYKSLFFVKADITDPEALKLAAEETAKVTGGGLDVLINNAAYQDDTYAFHGIDQFPSEQALIENFNKAWSTNVLGPILTTNAFLPLLRKGTVKKVLTLSSGKGDPAAVLQSGFEGSASYSVTKCALEMVNVKFATRLANEGFIFLAISPGVVNTASAPPPPEVMPLLMKMVGSFKKVYPDWKGPMEPPESVRLMLGVLDNATPNENGAFLSHLGNKQWL